MKRLSVKLSVILAVMASCICMCSLAHAASFAPVQSRLTSGTAYEAYAGHTIEMTPPGDYSFEFAQGMRPSGLSLSADGHLTGTPTSYMFGYVYISITDNATGESDIFPFYIAIEPISVRVNVSAPEVTYTEGGVYTASATLTDKDGNDIIVNGQKLEPIVFYGADYAKDVRSAGSHKIEVFAPSGCRMLGDPTGDRFLVVNKNTSASIRFDDSNVWTLPYDTHTHPITATATPAEAGVRVEYRKQGDESAAFTTAAPSGCGVYEVRALTTNPNYETEPITQTLTITGESINFTISDTVHSYSDSNKKATVTSDKDDEEDRSLYGYTVMYRDRSNPGAEPVEEPTQAGEYDILIELNNSDACSKGTVTGPQTLTVNPVSLLFTAPSTELNYTGAEQDPGVTTETQVPDGLYTVQYSKRPENTVMPVKASGRYDVVITLSDTRNYVIDPASVSLITVTGAELTVNVTNNTATYDPEGEGFTADVELFAGSTQISKDLYTVQYRLGNVTSQKAVGAGVYDIVIGLKDEGFMLPPQVTVPKMTVNPKKVTFNVEDNTHPYDGKPHTATVTGTGGIAKTGFNVRYRRAGVVSNDVTGAGVYDILVTVTDPNYALDESFGASMTITTTAVMSMGNSPAAMVYADSRYTDDEQGKAWRDAVLANLRSFGTFTAAENPDTAYVPENCDGSVVYTRINGLDVDSDPNTLIVRDIHNFSDAGFTVNGTLTAGVLAPASDSEGHEIEGLYTLTYTYDKDGTETKQQRYVMELKTRIGDAKNTGYVNATDANELQKLDTVPDGVTKARVWDVNKDGRLDKKDAAAIRERFVSPLRPYYPWFSK